jgi:hypothetical protein
MRRTLSAPTILFKGSGWAKKDRARATSAGARDQPASTGDKASGKDSQADGGGRPTEAGKGGASAGTPAPTNTDD